jgi:fructosamine-3-kinase
MIDPGRIEAAIASATGAESRIIRHRVAAGGCINDSRIVSLQDGREFFVKCPGLAGADPGMYAAEFDALTLIAAAGAVRVPRPVAQAEDFLVLEAFRPGAPAADWHESIGRQLALLHRNTRQKRCGFNRDNYLGSTPQPNRWSDDWLEFWRERRLRWQLRLYAGRTTPDDPLLRLGERLLERLDLLIGDINEPSVLLHGDLWSGNAAAIETGEPIIFDPASYYGHREAELGMMRMFGGFGPRCEAAYSEVWPLVPGASRRISLYRLYHELNHLNIFGQGYYGSCVATIKQLL